MICGRTCAIQGNEWLYVQYLILQVQWGETKFEEEYTVVFKEN